MPCLARSMATLAAHPPALVGMESTATNCPGGGHSGMGPQKVSSTRIPAQPTSVISWFYPMAAPISVSPSARVKTKLVGTWHSNLSIPVVIVIVIALLRDKGKRLRLRQGSGGFIPAVAFWFPLAPD